MSAATFSAPIEAEDIRTGMPVLILAIHREGVLLVVKDDGFLDSVPISSIRMNWLYDWREHRWLEGVESGEDETSDGGSDLPGSVSDSDRISQGDSIDEEGQSTPGDPGHLDAGEEDQ